MKKSEKHVFQLLTLFWVYVCFPTDPGLKKTTFFVFPKFVFFWKSHLLSKYLWYFFVIFGIVLFLGLFRKVWPLNLRCCWLFWVIYENLVNFPPQKWRMTLFLSSFRWEKIKNTKNTKKKPFFEVEKDDGDISKKNK